jgi:hypothetical protein
MSAIGKLAEISLRRLCVGMGCFLWIMEAAKGYGLSRYHDVNLPLASYSIPTHALITRFVIFLHRKVAAVLQSRCLAQIAKAIIVFLRIDVIDFIMRPIPRHIQPREAMSAIGNPIYPYLNISPALSVPGMVADLNPRRRSNFPGKTASFGTVIQQFAQSLSIHDLILTGA